MAGKRRQRGKQQKERKPVRPEPIPPGATRRASDHDLRPGEEPPPHPPDEEAAGTPGGGTEVGGLAGTNVDEGAPENADLERIMGRGDVAEEAEGEPPYAGPSGGAVGGTPAEGRASGGHTGRGLAPGGRHHGDSTIGTNPPPGRGQSGRRGDRSCG
jgi:hypothetical protein